MIERSERRGSIWVDYLAVFGTIMICVIFYRTFLMPEDAKPDPTDPKSSYVMREYPLLEAPCYTDARCSCVEMRLITNVYGGVIEVITPVSALTVELRSDGKTHTSLKYLGENTLENSCKTAVLLVPLAEDVIVWQTEINRWQKMRQEYLDSLPKPRRILPKT